MAMKTAQDTAPLRGHSTMANSTVTITTSHSRALLCKSGESRGSGGGLGGWVMAAKVSTSHEVEKPPEGGLIGKPWPAQGLT